MATLFLFDIETGPQVPARLAQAMPELDVTRYELGEFTPDSVKTGNTKDPDKIRAKIEEARVAHSLAKEKAKQDLKDAQAKHRADFEGKAALSAITGRVLAYGWGVGRTVEIVAPGLGQQASATSPEHSDQCELEVLDTFWEGYREASRNGDKMVGWNIFGFDLPFLVQRSWVHGVDVPHCVLQDGRFWNPLFVDLMKVWSCGAYGSFTKLDAVAKLFGLAGKTEGVTGADFARLYIESPNEAVAYLKQDVLLTAEIADRLQI